MNDHERGLLTFLVEPARGRIQRLLALGEKRRDDVRAMLDHSVRLDHRFCRHLKGDDAFPAAVEVLLRRQGAPENCYVLASDSDLDGREMRLRDALESVIGQGNGAYLSCIPGQLGFYEYEDAKWSYLLTRAPGT